MAYRLLSEALNFSCVPSWDFSSPRRMSRTTSAFPAAGAEAPKWVRAAAVRKRPQALRTGERRWSMCGKMPGDPGIVLSLSVFPNSAVQKSLIASFR